MDPMEQYKEAKAKMKVAMEEANNVVKDAFKSAAKSLFADNSDLVSFSWRQYTPYFNDGDECVFGSHTDYPYINGSDPWDVEEDQKEKSEAMQKKVVAFLGVFDDEDFKSMFGDHCEVTVTPTEIEVEEYDHD